MAIHILSTERLREGSDALIQIDPDFQKIVDQYGYSPFYKRETGFNTLLWIILEQQVSLDSAKAAYFKLVDRLDGNLTPQTFLTLDDDELKAVGFSRQKTRYGRELSTALVHGYLDLDRLESMPDDKVRETLIKIKGIGPWTANIYLLMALARQDIWPAGDIALEEGIKQLKGLEKRPKKDDFVAWGEKWRPWRSVAAHLLWHYYLCLRGRSSQ
ncbi:MAG: DNA-3-methyladenine glycosylase 2 family protein [Chloroflexota bacterium]